MPANTGGCRADGVCQTIGAATGGSNHQRVMSGLTDPCSTASSGWVNLFAYGAQIPANPFSPCGFISAIPCIGGSAQGDCQGFIPGDIPGGTGFGNSGVGAIMGPGQNNWDMSIMKDTKVTERTSLQFRAEFYNIWNHAQFNPPFNSVGSATTFGRITSSSVPPRVVQFGLKLLF